MSSVAGVAVLHVARTELSPVRDRLSEYANGPDGVVMTVSFVTLGAGTILVGLSLGAAGPMHGWSRAIPLAVIAAGFGMVVSGLYATDPAGAATRNERVHSLASGSATMMLIVAAVASAVLSRARRPREPVSAAGVLAFAALGFGAVSPFLHGTALTGLSQRALWVTLMGWLLVTSWHLARALTRGALRNLPDPGWSAPRFRRRRRRPRQPECQ